MSRFWSGNNTGGKSGYFSLPTSNFRRDCNLGTFPRLEFEAEKYAAGKLSKDGAMSRRRLTACARALLTFLRICEENYRATIQMTEGTTYECPEIRVICHDSM